MATLARIACASGLPAPPRRAAAAVGLAVAAAVAAAVGLAAAIAAAAVAAAVAPAEAGAAAAVAAAGPAATVAAASYDFFREGVKWALRAALDGAASQQCTVVLLPKIACGLYAGPHRREINDEFQAIVDEVLGEHAQPSGLPLGRYFDRVVLTVVPREPSP